MKGTPASFITTMDSPQEGWVNIGRNLYVFLSIPTASKIQVLEAVFEKIGISGEDLHFEIRLDETNNSQETQ